jgi:adenylylsulfate kinase
MSWAIWITGLPGSGKSAIARAAAAELAAHGEPVQVLELDVLRVTLTPAASYDDAERDAVYRALVVIARVLTSAGCPVIIDATAHRREWRDLARASIGDFAEVQLVCPLEVAREPGVDVPYEPAVAPEIAIDTTRETVTAAGARVAALARAFARRVLPPSTGGGWTLWISGRPGSGKTTVVSGLCERLGGRGVSVTVLDPIEYAGAIVPKAARSRAQREIVARAIVETAKRLSDGGGAVVVDGAPPLRDAGSLARERIGSFAQVELACAPDVCRTRERAVRWNLVPCPGGQRPMAPPDLGLDYEPAVCPDLILYTDALDEGMAADEVVRLVDRLERAARERRRSPILVVDDEAEFLATYSRLLARDGFLVVTADSRAAALQALDEGRFSLVIADIRLPDGDGLDVVRRARAGATPIPAIVVSGFGSKSVRDAAVQAGAAAFFAKPFEAATLAARVRHLVQ